MSTGTVVFVGRVAKVFSDGRSLIEIFEEYCEGLSGLEGFSHAIILYWFHQRDSEEHRKTLWVRPRGRPENPLVGVFSSRSPSRPNPIGLCVVELIEVEKCRLVVKGLDAYEGSPVLDIKPYIPRIDAFPHAKTPDWLSS